MSSFSPEQLDKMKSTRMWWMGIFPLVNVSRMKRLALIYLELCPDTKLNTQASKWINLHKGRPSTATRLGKNDKTTEILKGDIKALMDNKSLWKKYKKLFRKIPDYDTEDVEDYDLSDDEMRFLNTMRSPWVRMKSVGVFEEDIDNYDPTAVGVAGSSMYEVHNFDDDHDSNNEDADQNNNKTNNDNGTSSNESGVNVVDNTAQGTIVETENVNDGTVAPIPVEPPEIPDEAPPIESNVPELTENV
jgi:hypothetical protein